MKALYIDPLINRSIDPIHWAWMRRLALLLFVAGLASCGPKTAPALPGVAPAATPAPLLGHITRAQLRAYEPWALFWEQAYVPDPNAVASIKKDAKGLNILLVMGTWCPDSKRELPRYFATADAAGIGNSKLRMIGVDRTKKDPEGLTDKWNITRVPTFIFLRSGKEIGRFVEHTPADSTFEAEMARILRGGSGAVSR
jgi:thiol-disulfide isomerase/thioredoxin